ncbi:MAG: hypothetical protein Q7T80_16715 [Methanoregula sp.]|nr:hypothetical protein [Methanoregula sp.]
MNAYSYLALMLLGFLFTGASSVFLTAEHGITRKKVLSSGILSGIIAGIVLSSFYLYTDIWLNPLNYPPFPGDFLKLWIFFHGISSGLFILGGISMLTGMIVATIGALASGFLHQRYGKPAGSVADSVKNGNLHRIILIALSIIIVAILIIPLVIVATGIEQGAIAREPFGPVSFGSAGLTVPLDQPAGIDHASNVTRWMQEHAGQEVTTGEYLEITNPGYLASHSQEVREGYYRMKIRVPNFSSPDPGDDDRSAGSMQYGKRSVAIAAFGYREIPDDQQPVYSANYTSQCVMNGSMISISNGLVGTEISVGKYLETVCPDYLAGMPESQKAPLYNVTIPVSKIPDNAQTAVFGPPLSVAITEIEYNPPEWVNVVIYGIFGFVVVAFGYLTIRRYRK